jgi:peptidyl-prolyl cis-trans isomerase A (cyclophilin A)
MSFNRSSIQEPVLTASLSERLQGVGAASMLLALLSACGGGGGAAGNPAPTPPAPTPPCVASAPPSAPAPSGLPPQVTLTIANGAGVSGTLVITLEPAAAPVTTANFLQYVNSGFYNCTVFQRHGRTSSLGPFVLQGGGYTAPVASASAFPAAKPTLAPIALETGRGLSNLRNSVAMARTSALNSATSEFFINTTDNAFLDTSGGGYAVFGSITAGTELIPSMLAATCNASAVNFGLGSPDCVPEPNLVITRAVQSR